MKEFKQKLQNARYNLRKYRARMDDYGVRKYKAARQEFHELLKNKKYIGNKGKNSFGYMMEIRILTFFTNMHQVVREIIH